MGSPVPAFDVISSENNAMSETTDRDDIVTVIPARATALSRGRFHLVDTLSLSRLRRRALIRDIEAQTQRVVLCYVSERRPIVREDVLHWEALLQGVHPRDKVTLLLNSPGGDPDAAEKLLYMLREVVSPPASQQSGDLEIVVPNEAKSAATLMALGADRVTMSDTSELGPIDPQVESHGVLYSVAAWLTAYRRAERRCREHPDNSAFAAVFQSLNPVIAEMLRLAESRVLVLAEELAKRAGLNYTMVAKTLMDTQRFLSHGQMIDWRTARDIGLEHVQYKPRNDPAWKKYWNLYRALRVIAGHENKIFESRDITRLG